MGSQESDMTEHLIHMLSDTVHTGPEMKVE